MARIGLSLVVCALLSALTPSLAEARPEETKDKQIETLLKLNHACNLGRDYLTSGQYQRAVNVLEAELPSAMGNKDYLLLLRDAYRALIEDLRKQKSFDEIPRYQRHLDLLVGNLIPDPAPAAIVMPPPPRLPQAPAAPPVVQALTAPAALASTPPPAAAQPQPTATKPPAITARGVPAEDPLDPFSEANSKQLELARKYLVKAEQEFVSGRYLVASGLYEQAYHADEKALGEARVRWAYCRLVDVREALNRSTPPPSGELEQRVRQAMSLAPEATQLSKFGQDLLLVIQKRSTQTTSSAPAAGDQAAAIPLRHTPRVEGASWAIVDTTNFRVYHNLDPELAGQAARAAETARTAGLRKWFGEESGSWNPRCELYLYANGQDYASATGQPTDCPGHSSVGQSGERIHSRRIDIHVDAANWITGVLPHETTHVVIAGHFGPHSVPRWADEGMAVLAEPRDLVQRHLRNLPMHRKDQQLFSLRELLNLDNYPKPRQVGAFYAQSVSLVDYLSRQPGGPQKFSTFLRDGLRDGYDVSLKQHYGLNSLQELEGYWTRFAFQELASQPPTSSYAP